MSVFSGLWKAWVSLFFFLLLSVFNLDKKYQPLYELTKRRYSALLLLIKKITIRRTKMQWVFNKTLIAVIVTFFSVTSINITHAADLSGDINVDNEHTTYISTDNSVAGTLISSGNNWPLTDSFAGIVLTPGIPYFLHVNGIDVGGVAAFLGDFTLTGGGHTFAGGGTTITTGTTNWLVSTTGWSSYVVPTGYGLNGVAPWGVRPPPADPAAEWIWSADNNLDNNVYFTLAINPTPVDVSITKTLDTAGPYQIADTVQFTLTVTNNGPGVAANIDVTDTPNNLTITSVSSTNCAAMPCNISSLANGISEIITVMATIDSVGAFENSASVTSITPDTNPANNSVTSTSETALPVSVPTLSQWALLSLMLLLLVTGVKSRRFKF
ncbi:MAG: DUF11 domain-containing protein [Porticoccus sp.]|nr:DUF11 domain-containing protein [Porticoccus sp.]